MEEKVRVFDGDEVIGLAEYISNLDHWDGRNWTSGSTGRHLGLGKLKDGRYYLCHGTQWQGEQNYAEIISEEEAKQYCLKHNPDEWKHLFDDELPILD